jgi:CheY-like chemotaxis protein
MATILLIEEEPDLALFEVKLLEDKGHRVIRCGGGLNPLSACPLMRFGDCPVPEPADLILFSCPLYAPVLRRSYRGEALLRTYRSHPRYGSVPMVVVSAGAPADLSGTGPLAFVRKFSSPGAVIAAVEEMLLAAATN